MLYLLGRTTEQVVADSRLHGMITENFVISELEKQITWSKTKPKLYHYRTTSGQEIDLIMESQDGRVVAIEIKSSSNLKSDFWKQLKQLKMDLGGKFVKGIILYTGSKVIQLDEKLWALPISGLWEIETVEAENVFK